MYPYQLSKVLADQRIHDMVAAGERHRLVAAAQRPHRGLTQSPSRLKDVISQMVTLLHVRASARAHSSVTSTRAGGTTMTSASGAGPVGCSA